ncbi:MAG: chorismate lyase [Gammaproteobacteria bacterium]|nr:chorismate lyase [Gammaproteobacteria bacterium]
MHASSKNLKEPLWRPHRRVSRAYVPAHLRPWLLDTGSLTQRIIAACGGEFSVVVLRQAWARPMRNEALRLGLRPDAYAVLREVKLVCNGRPWVYARTIIPASTLTGSERRLHWLGSRSLGAVLFADPSVARSEIEVARALPNDRLYEQATALLSERPAEVWARRAQFTLKGKPLLVSEVFLPAVGSFPLSCN